MLSGELNGRRDFDNTQRTLIIPAGSDTIDQTVVIPIIEDRINEANEGFLLIVRANQVLSNPSDVANLIFIDEGVTLLRIVDDDSKGAANYNTNQILFHSPYSHYISL